MTDSFVAAIALSAVLVLVTLYFHFVCLKFGARLVFEGAIQVRWPVFVVVTVLFAAHMVEVMLYALAFMLMEALGMGTLKGIPAASVQPLYDLFYFSIASYSTLGIGDILPTGHIRLVAGIESLNGLVLVAWSSSFTYLMMERSWGNLIPGSARQTNQAGISSERSL